LGQRHLPPPAPGVRGRDHQTHFIDREWFELQVGGIRLAAHQPEMDLAVLNLAQYRSAIGDGRPDLNVRITLSKDGQQLRQEVLAGNRAGRQEQLTRDDRFAARDFATGFFVQGEDALSEGIETLAGFGQLGSAAVALEQRGPQLLFQRVDALADSPLSEPQDRSRGGEATVLGRDGEGFQMRQRLARHGSGFEGCEVLRLFYLLLFRRRHAISPNLPSPPLADAITISDATFQLPRGLKPWGT